jgi:hypothetical protein
VYARDLGDDWRMVSYDGAKWVRAAYDYAGSFV